MTAAAQTLLSKKFRPFIVGLLFIVTIAAIIVTDYNVFSWEFLGPGHLATTATYFAQDNYDIPPLLLRMRQCTSFLQTRSYWHEEYTPGVAFYRPLSLTWFWFEYHLFGTNNYGQWTTVSLCLHLLFCFVFYIFIRDLTRSRISAVIALFFFAGINAPITLLHSRLLSDSLPTAAAVLPVIDWKDQPTLIADTNTVLALISSLRGRWLIGLICALTSVLFKESGWCSYVLVFLMMAANGRLPKIPIWVYLGAAVCIALPMALRSIANMGLVGGYYVGHNYEWKTRYVNAVIGCFLNPAIHGQWPATLLGVALYVLVQQKKIGFIIRCGIAGILLMIAGALFAAIDSASSLPIGMLMILDPVDALNAVILGFLLAALIKALTHEKELGKNAVLLAIFSLITGIGYVAALQVNVHALHLCLAFQSAATATGFTALYRAMTEKSECASTLAGLEALSA